MQYSEPKTSKAFVAVSLGVTMITPQPTVRAFLGEMCCDELVMRFVTLCLSDTCKSHRASQVRELMAAWTGSAVAEAQGLFLSSLYTPAVVTIALLILNDKPRQGGD